MKTRLIVFLLFCAAVLPFCTSPKGAVTAAAPAQPAITYIKDIAPIMQARCTPCHYPEQGKKKFLDTYAATRDNIDDIIRRVELPQSDPEFMPFKNKKEPLSDSLIMVFKQWKELNMPE